MQEFAQLLLLGGLLVGFSAAIVARVRQAWLGRTVLLILLAPAIPMVTIFTLGALFSPANGTILYGLVFAIMLIGTIILVPWLLACGIGVAIGLALRRKRPQELRLPATPTPVQSAPPPAPRASAIASNRADKQTFAPLAAWGTALILLIGALAAIAGLTYLSETYGFDPPRVPTMPHIPRTVP